MRPIFVALAGAAVGLVAAAACGSPPVPLIGVGESTADPIKGHTTVTSDSDGGVTSTFNANETLAQHVDRLHKSAIVIDTHDDIPSVMFEAGNDIGDKAPWNNTDLARMKTGGLTGLFFSVYVSSELVDKPTVIGGGPARRALDLIDITYRAVERHPDDLVLATGTADIRRAKREGKIAILMGIEGGHAIENSLSALRDFYRLGVRYMTLTHTNTNEWADSAGGSTPAPVRHHGLAPFGEEVVAEMQRLGMLVDISHVSDETFDDVIRVAKAPVIASHSSSRAIADHRRNMSDDMLKALAKNGGVVMVNFWSTLMSNEYNTASQAWFAKHGAEFTALRAQYKTDPAGFKKALTELRANDNFPKVPLAAVVDHIDHIVKVAGIDHVGLGSDFDGVDALPEGLDGVDKYPLITEELIKRGYKDDDIMKILGENFMHAFEKAEAYSHSKPGRISGDGNQHKITQQ